MKFKKINLTEFEVAKLRINEIVIAKGGSGASFSNNGFTMCFGSDHDFMNCCDID